jgi:hypothetical protein
MVTSSSETKTDFDACCILENAVHNTPNIKLLILRTYNAIAKRRGTKILKPIAFI